MGQSFAQGLFAIIIAAFLLTSLGCKPAGHSIKFPKQVVLEDFQTPLDHDLSELLLKVDRSKAGRLFSQHVMKPIFDDVNVAQLTVGAIEIRPGQFPDRPEIGRIVDECARVLQMPKPRVFIIDSPGLRTSSVNFAEPVILIPSRILKNFTDLAELRFIIGREMGHIRCGHTKWQQILGRVMAELGGFNSIPEQIGAIPIMPFLKWSREAEISADNAGLICCQNPMAAERVLAAFLIGARDSSIGEVDVDSLLKQRNNTEYSQVSEWALLWREAVQQHPFVPDRIALLRGYAASRGYQRLWD